MLPVHRVRSPLVVSGPHPFPVLVDRPNSSGGGGSRLIESRDQHFLDPPERPAEQLTQKRIVQTASEVARMVAVVEYSFMSSPAEEVRHRDDSRVFTIRLLSPMN
jgi:hypothetical protein